MTSEDRKRQEREDALDELARLGQEFDAIKAQWTADQIARAQQQDACYIERLARKDFEPARFANLRTGGNMPRAKPGRIRLWIGNAIGLACIIVIALTFYVVMP